MKPMRTTLTLIISLAGAMGLHAQTIDWLGTPEDGDWFNGDNWTGGVPPSGASQTAGFGTSTVTDVLISTASGGVGAIDMASGAPVYTISFEGLSGDFNSPDVFEISGAGFTGDSGSLNWVLDGSQTISQTRFTGGATAGNASFSSLRHPDWESWAYLIFEDTSTAGQAQMQFDGAEVEFRNQSTMGGATAVLDDTTWMSFSDAATAANGEFTLQDNWSRLRFHADATAADARITSVGDGRVEFFDGSGAADAEINSNGRITFWNESSAEAATIITTDQIFFEDSSSAGTAYLEADGSVEFFGNASAGDSTIVLGSEGVLWFNVGTDAGSANITIPGDAQGNLQSQTQAGDSEWDIAGTVRLRGNGQDASMIIRDGGELLITASGATPVDPGNMQVVVESGGSVEFENSTADSTASFEVQSGGVFSLAGINSNHVTLGAISGGGDFVIGVGSFHPASFEFRVGGDDSDQVVDGVLSDGDNAERVGNLVKEGEGTLTLNNANTYSGYTLVRDGGLVVNGSIESDVTVEEGALLGGSGTVGDIVLESGATLSPGNSAGTLSADSLAWESGAILVFDLGPDSDFLDLDGSFTGTGGDGFLFQFADNGWMEGETYSLVGFDSTNFALGDFGFTNNGLFDGQFQWDDALNPAVLEFHLTVIPEPKTCLLVGVGLLLILFRRRMKGK